MPIGDEIINATVVEMQVNGALWLAYPSTRIPQPGQYLYSWSPADSSAPLPAVLFPGGLEWLADPQPEEQAGGQIYLHCAPGAPQSWGIGTPLKLRGPLGRGFDLPGKVQNLALVSLGGSAERLLPLIPPVLDRNGAVALFSDQALPQLPMAVEAYPLGAIAELLDWPNYFVLEMPVERLAGLRDLLELAAHERLPAPAQALVDLPMPCGSLGDCGACTVYGRYSSFLACEDGPVFDLERLDW